MASCTEKHNTVGHSIGRMLLRHGIHEFFGQGLPQGLSLPFEELGLRQIAYRTQPLTIFEPTSVESFSSRIFAHTQGHLSVCFRSSRIKALSLCG